MISQIQKATKELEDILSNDNFKLFKDKENHYKQLFENANISFFNTCKICYEINNNKSFCSCDVNFNYGLGVEKAKRVELKNYMDIFQSVNKNSNLFQWKTGISNVKGLTDEERYILSIEPLFDTIETETEKEEEFVPLKIDIVQIEKENDFVLSKEDLKILGDAFKSDLKNETELKNKIDLANNNDVQFYKDVFLPVGTYIAIMQLPILIFISRFFKYLIAIVSKSELMQISFFVFAIGVFGLVVLKSEYENIKIKFFKDLYSEKSQTIHFFSSLVIVSISTYEVTIFFITVGIIIWLISNLKKIKNKFQDSYINKLLNSIWKKIVDILGY